MISFNEVLRTFYGIAPAHRNRRSLTEEFPLGPIRSMFAR
jgi:hypothetical protein